MDIVLQRILELLPHTEDGKIVHGEKKKFAQSLGLAHNLVTMWEKGQSKSYSKLIYEIAAKYEVSPEWLKGETDGKNPTADGDGKEKGILDDLTEAELLQVKDYIEFIKSKRS